MQTFASTLFANKRRLSVVSVTDQTLSKALSGIQDVLLADANQKNAKGSFTTVMHLLKELELYLYESSEVPIYQQHYLTLLALNESIIDDKVASLPLLLRLTTSSSDLDVHHLDCYLQFLRQCRQRGYFGHRTQDIIQPKLVEAIS